ERQDGHIVLRVRDSGMGIEPTLLPTVFDLFAQGRAASARAPGGVGIGLTLVRTLVQMHGGTVAAESAGPGKGSVFTIRLPAGSVEPPVTAAELGAGTQAQAVAVPEILVVDDNADAAESLAALLEMLGARARVTHDGVAALAACRERLPHIAF